MVHSPKASVSSCLLSFLFYFSFQFHLSHTSSSLLACCSDTVADGTAALHCPRAGSLKLLSLTGLQRLNSISSFQLLKGIKINSNSYLPPIPVVDTRNNVITNTKGSSLCNQCERSEWVKCALYTLSARTGSML